MVAGDVAQAAGVEPKCLEAVKRDGSARLALGGHGRIAEFRRVEAQIYGHSFAGALVPGRAYPIFAPGIGRVTVSDKRVKKVVLAYSGGLDTSVILKWLQTAYGAEVVTFTADLGQGEELEPARKKAELLGIKPENIFIEDLREEFVRDYVFPMFRANARL